MKGQLSQRPVAELIREISAKSQSGSLRIEQDRIKIAAYFYKGQLVYAACNLRDLRLRAHLQRTSLLSAEQLARFDENLPDLELAKNLCNANLLTQGEVEEAQMKQVSDIVRFALTLNDGSWTFDSRAHLNESVNLNIDVDALLVWAEERAPATKAVEEPAESEPDAETFLERLRTAETHYDVLGVETSAAPETLKAAYYDLARRYHPDRFRKADPSLLTRLESAFARITQAYDTLRDDDLRANYNAKLQARRKAQQIAEATAKRAAATTETGAIDDTPQVSVAQRAANDFKEGLAALEQGQRKLAAGLFASAARLVPNEARYRAYYGHMLAGQETTRRAAEAELQAAIKLDPGNANYRVMLAQLFRDLGFSLRAKGEAERAVAADPNNQKARDLLRELKGV